MRLEIGFGGGEHLLAEAERAPDVGFIGVEPFENGMANMAVDAHRARRISATSASSTTTRPCCSTGCRQIRSRASTCSFPIRGRSKRHWKRRFVSADNLARIARVLRPDGVFRFASDVAATSTGRSARSPANGSFHCTGGSDGGRSLRGWPGRATRRRRSRRTRPAYLRLCQSGGAADKRGALDNLDAPEAGNEVACPDREAEDAEIGESRIGRRIRVAREIGMAKRGFGIGRRAFRRG